MTPENRVTSLPLLPMRPLFLEKIWGGDRLQRWPEKGAPPGRPVGESWEVADLPEGHSVVASGPLEGRALGALVDEHGDALCGRRSPEGRFPLLVKIVDAGDDLSVQVHPGRDYARAHPGARSKDECWLILDAAPGACVLHGLREGVGRDDFEAAIRAHRAQDLLRRVPVKAGDVVRVAPGTVHAICRGVTVLEVQEPSDTTFRVYDYGRLEAGLPRPLHVEQALEVMRFGAQPDALAAPLPLESSAASDDDGAPWRVEGGRRELLVDAPAYRLERLRLQQGGSAALALDPSSPLVVFCIEGAIVVETTGGPCALARGGSLVAPASSGAIRMSSSGAPAELALAGLPRAVR